MEFDGVTVGTPPFEKDFPGGSFPNTRTSMGSRLEHPVVASFSFTGYASKELKLTEGPMNWISLNGRNRGQYWLFKSDHFSVDLQPISETFSDAITAKVSDVGVDLRPELPLEELVRNAKPAVVYLKDWTKPAQGSSSPARASSSPTPNSPAAKKLCSHFFPPASQGRLRGPWPRVALAKVERPQQNMTHPHGRRQRQGESVLAIGNPGKAMLERHIVRSRRAEGLFPPKSLHATQTKR